MKNRAGQCRRFIFGAVAFLILVQSALGQFNFSTNNGAIIITGYTGSGPSVTIPGTTNGYTVTTIGNSAFAGDSVVTSIRIPATVTNIGAFAFASSGLTSVTIPISIIGIGQQAFASCSSLTNISAAAGNPAYSSLNGVLFDKTQDTLLQYPVALTNGNYIVPGTVSTIASNSFYGAFALSSVTIPGKVNSIGNGAFADCIALSSIYFSGNAPNVGPDALGSGVTVYYIPGTTGWAAFSTALGRPLASLDLWYLPNPEIINFGVHNAQFGFIIYWATNAALVVDVCSNLSNPVWLPVSTYVVAATNGTASFTDPQSSNFKKRFYRLQVGSLPFAYSTINGAITITGYTGSNPSAAIPAAINGYPVTTIGNTAFGGNAILTGISIPTSVTNIGAFAFASSGLTSLTIPAGVIGIGQEAFISCSSLTNISVAAGNPAYSSLKGVLFDKPQNNLLQYPPGLVTDNYTVPGTVTNIAAYAFYLASGFASVTIPINVTGIGQEAFAFCSAQNNNYLQVYFQGNAPAAGLDAFYDDGFDYGVSVYYIPGTTGWSTWSTALGSSLQSLNLWYLSAPQILNFEPSFGLHPNGRFGFTISWATNASVVVEASGNSSDPVWTPISTNVVTATTGTANFLDPLTKSYIQRYYRLRSP